MDWNWFFSSVAQSVAALAGFFGAFVISKLLNNEAAYVRNRTRTQELVRESDRLVDAGRVRPFDWYNRRTLEYAIHDLEDALKETDEVASPDAYYEQFDFPEYLPKQKSLEAIERTILNERDRRRQEDAKQRARSMGIGGVLGLAVPGPIINGEMMSRIQIGSHQRWQQYEKEREAIRQWVLAVKNHSRAVQEHLTVIDRNPERSSVIRWSLVVILLLFWAGVVYPLSFLPVPPNWTPQLSVARFFDILASLRGAILAMITIVFSGLIVALYKLNQSFEHPSGDLAALMQRVTVDFYSPFLRVRLDNGIPV